MPSSTKSFNIVKASDQFDATYLCSTSEGGHQIQLRSRDRDGVFLNIKAGNTIAPRRASEPKACDQIVPGTNGTTQCTAIFSSDGLLKQHKEVFHQYRPFECDACHRIFGDTTVAKRHTCKATGVSHFKQYVCTVAGCRNTTSPQRSDNMKRHDNKLHSGQKAYVEFNQVSTDDAEEDANPIKNPSKQRHGRPQQRQYTPYPVPARSMPIPQPQHSTNFGPFPYADDLHTAASLPSHPVGANYRDFYRNATGPVFQNVFPGSIESPSPPYNQLMANRFPGTVNSTMPMPMPMPVDPLVSAMTFSSQCEDDYSGVISSHEEPDMFNGSMEMGQVPELDIPDFNINGIAPSFSWPDQNDSYLNNNMFTNDIALSNTFLNDAGNNLGMTPSPIQDLQSDRTSKRLTQLDEITPCDLDFIANMTQSAYAPANSLPDMFENPEMLDMDVSASFTMPYLVATGKAVQGPVDSIDPAALLVDEQDKEWARQLQRDLDENQVQHTSAPQPLPDVSERT